MRYQFRFRFVPCYFFAREKECGALLVAWHCIVALNAKPHCALSCKLHAVFVLSVLSVPFRATTREAKPSTSKETTNSSYTSHRKPRQCWLENRLRDVPRRHDGLRLRLRRLVSPSTRTRMCGGNVTCAMYDRARLRTTGVCVWRLRFSFSTTRRLTKTVHTPSSLLSQKQGRKTLNE